MTRYGRRVTRGRDPYNIFKVYPAEWNGELRRQVAIDVRPLGMGRSVGRCRTRPRGNRECHHDRHRPHQPPVYELVRTKSLHWRSRGASVDLAPPAVLCSTADINDLQFETITDSKSRNNVARHLRRNRDDTTTDFQWPPREWQPIDSIIDCI
jgi:hypothetical protein